MTYCLGIVTRSGLVMAADSRTNAGIDNVSTYRKLFDFSKPGQRVLLLCTSGNLSSTQAAIASLQKDIKVDADVNLHNLPSMYDIARYIGEKIRQVHDRDSDWLRKDGIDPQCNILLGGQVEDDRPELFLIYSQGNCIQATVETPYLQIGETKYGKPILDRTVFYETSLESAAKCALLSIDSTMRSNVSVGPPIDLAMYYADTFELNHRLKLFAGDPYLLAIRKRWQFALQEAFENIPDIDWEHRSPGPDAIYDFSNEK